MILATKGDGKVGSMVRRMVLTAVTPIAVTVLFSSSALNALELLCLPEEITKEEFEVAWSARTSS